MPFKDELIQQINEYVTGHLPKDDWYEDYFSFIEDDKLAKRLEKEYKTIRYIYKILEGLQCADELQLAQVRIQVIFYTSIYEAMVHYLLFDKLKDQKKVEELFYITMPVKISIPESKRVKILNALEHNGSEILTYEMKKKKTEESKIRFDAKADVMHQLGLIDDTLKSELIQFYEYRNAIHIHAEIKKDIEYELEMARTAYRRFQIFREQVVEGLKKYQCPSPNPSTLMESNTQNLSG
ncbi:hypothetical protein [Sulfuricurvum sp.]|uniref:hypothetical protein n=1 Tax=Sulfuricurvum sp. TaxID=2025608 RepID=UPI002D4EF5EF|nr:hypothetical protein [Sulfuricurvum sp.]HZF69391.1 hypothetical protein [Sulfuricurvum sp.]